MAKFGQQFIQSLLQPSYQQGLFTAAEQLGARPRLMAEQQMMAGIDTNTPQGLQQLAKFYQAKGDMANAVKTAAAARELATQTKTLSAVEGLRNNIIERAGEIEGLENMATAAVNATPQQLEEMRKTVLAEEFRIQQEKEAFNEASEAARNLKVNEDLINVFSDDAEGLQTLVRSITEYQTTQALEKAGEKATATAMANRAKSYNAPQEIIDDIQDGFYKDQPLKALAAMRGEDSKNESYQNAETGEIFMLATKGAKVFKDGKWSLPSEIGLIEAPKVTAEGSVPKFRAENRSTTFLGFAAGATNRFINELDTFANLQGEVLLSSVSPLTTDATEALDGYRNYVREALVRFTSGAAVQQNEIKRYTDMVNITFNDFISPKSMVHKIIAASALTSINAKLTAGEITPAEARILADEAGNVTLTDEDYDLLRSDRPGSMKKVVKKYTDPLLGNDVSATARTTDSILSKYNF